jgi:hypothetical protein
MRVSKIEHRFDVLEKFALESGIEYTGAVNKFAMKIKRHLIQEIRNKSATHVGVSSSPTAVVEDVIEILERLS